MTTQNKYDKQHLRNLAAIEKQIEKIYNIAVKEAAAIATTIYEFNPDKPFTFDDYPITKERIDSLLKDMQKKIDVTVKNGIDEAWVLSNAKNDALCDFVLGGYAATEEMKKRYYGTREGAKEAFLKRKTAGLNLSDRVWNYTSQFKSEIEMGLDLGIRNGHPAAEMARELQQYLKYPDKLFRRVRDIHGQLHLSKAAKAFHPGQGVYRSSYKNALRLAATETNMAYRTADHERWQQLDFIVGQEVRLSNNHTINGVPFTDICDDLKGKYPNTFKFVGWHPLCRCNVISILKTDKEMDEDVQRILNGEEPLTGSENEVKDVPDKFKEWIEKNSDRIAAAEKRGTLPYFIKDNRSAVMTVADKANELQIIKPVKADNADTPHPAMKTKYQTTKDIDETFKKINAEFTSNRWFEHGDLKIDDKASVGTNGSTDVKGGISLTKQRLEHVKSAMGKIGQGKSADMTKEEADAMATLWHEITHNRNLPGNMRKTNLQTKYSELANEFVARKTLPEFYSKLGCKDTPFPEFMSNRDSTGYNKMVNKYDWTIKRLGLDSDKVLATVRNHLFTGKYNDQQAGLIQGLKDGGTVKINSKEKIKQTELKKLLKMIQDKDKSQSDVEAWLLQNGFIEPPK
jgi:hypothetical protein